MVRVAFGGTPQPGRVADPVIAAGVSRNSKTAAPVDTEIGIAGGIFGLDSHQTEAQAVGCGGPVEGGVVIISDGKDGWGLSSLREQDKKLSEYQFAAREEVENLEKE